MQTNWKEFSKRLEIIMTARGLKNPNELVQSLGYKGGEKVYRLFRDSGALPSIEIVVDVLRAFPEVNPKWFVLGEGEPFSNSVEISNKSEKPAYENLDLMKKVAAFEQDIKLRDMQYSQLMARFNDVLVKVSELMQEIDSIKKPLKKPIIQKATR